MQQDIQPFLWQLHVQARRCVCSKPFSLRHGCPPYALRSAKRPCGRTKVFHSCRHACCHPTTRKIRPQSFLIFQMQASLRWRNRTSQIVFIRNSDHVKFTKRDRGIRQETLKKPDASSASAFSELCADEASCRIRDQEQKLQNTASSLPQQKTSANILEVNGAAEGLPKRKQELVGRLHREVSGFRV